MAGFLSTLMGVFREQLERNRNRPFLRATMAASALVAMAEGRVTFPERCASIRSSRPWRP